MKNDFVYPTPTEIRHRIEAVKSKKYRIFLKSVYVLGAARVGELTGRMCSRDSQTINPRKNFVYGPKGTDVSLDSYQVENINTVDMIKVMNKVMTLENALPELEVALFRINIEKRKFNHLKEEPMSRLIGIPMDSAYEPWTKEIYDYFVQAKDRFVFPFTRQDIWRYITKINPIFEGLGYPIEKYTIKKEGKIVKDVARKMNPFKLHGLRHLRTKELFETYNFDSLDFMSYIGWSVGTSSGMGGAGGVPAMLPRYASIYEGWKRYFPKLLRKRTY